MNSAAPRTLLTRLRASARLAMLVLLIFAMKIGVAAACAKHDFVDMGRAADNSHAVMKVFPSDGGDTDLTKSKSGYSGNCNHCSCQHAPGMMPGLHVEFAVVPQQLGVRTSGLPPSGLAWPDLRPPIA